jgi:hypothetical protein
VTGADVQHEGALKDMRQERPWSWVLPPSRRSWNERHASAVNVSVLPLRFVVSRIVTMPKSLASSTQSPPFASL